MNAKGIVAEILHVCRLQRRARSTTGTVVDSPQTSIRELDWKKKRIKDKYWKYPKNRLNPFLLLLML